MTGVPFRYRRLTPVDRMYLALESPTAPMHFGALAIVDAGAAAVPWLDGDGRVRLAEVRAALRDRVEGMSELRRVVHGVGPLAGPPLWTDDPAFAIEHHVGAFGLPRTQAAAGEAGLFRAVERRMAPRLDRSRPLWQVWFIDGLPDRRVGVLFTVHHSLADGLSAMRLARELLAPALGGRSAEPSRAGQRVPPWPELVLDRALESIAAARALNVGQAADGVGEIVRSFLAGWATTRAEPDSGLNAGVGSRRRLATVVLDSRAVKRVARAHGAGANDLVLDLVAAGLRALLSARDRPIERIAPRVGIAVALPGGGDGEGEQAGNRFGSYVVELPVGEPDPLARLRMIAAARDVARRTQPVSGITSVRAWTARFWPTRELMRQQRYINVMETYLPGPPSPIEVLGAPVLDLIPIQPLGRNVGLVFIASSYAGKLTITVRADPDAFPDLDLVLAAMEGEWRSFAPLATPERMIAVPSP